MKRKSRAEIVLEIYDREAMGEVTPREIAIINRGLIEEFGEGGILAPAEIASILTDEDLPVRFDQIFNMSSPDDRYEQLFSSSIDLSSLDSAEDSLHRLDDLYSKLDRGGDRRGSEYALSLARRAKEAARAASESPHLTERQRAEQVEIAEWFTIWIRTPELLRSWLELRKNTAEFRRIFVSEETTEHLEE